MCIFIWLLFFMVFPHSVHFQDVPNTESCNFFILFTMSFSISPLSLCAEWIWAFRVFLVLYFLLHMEHLCQNPSRWISTCQDSLFLCLQTFPHSLHFHIHDPDSSLNFSLFSAMASLRVEIEFVSMVSSSELSVFIFLFAPYKGNIFHLKVFV